MKHLLTSLVGSFLFLSSAQAFEVVASSPKATRAVTPAVMIDLERKLGPDRWVENRDCRLKAVKRTVSRQFLRGSYNADLIELDFETAHLGPRRAFAVITKDSKWGAKSATDPQFGPVEDVRIELGDRDSTWIEFRHTGTHLVQFEIGNIRGLTLCLVR